MRHHYLLKSALIAIIGVLATISGCQTASTLSKKIEGEWSGTPMRFSKTTDINGEFTPTFRFERQGDSNGGDLTMSIPLSVMMPVNAPIDSLGTTPISATAAGIATIRGSWIASDDDEVDLRFDMSTLVVDMDNDIEFEYANVWASADTPSIQTVPDAVKKAFTKQMNDAVTFEIQRINKLDDISIKDNALTCKLFDQHLTLTRIYE